MEGTRLLPQEILARIGVPHVVHRHPEIRTADDVLERTGLPVETSVKTLAFEVGPGRVILAAIPGQAKIAYGALARALGVSRSALRPAGEAELMRIGMEAGGVCPVCMQPWVTIALDSRVPSMGRVYCGSGRADATFELEASDLPKLATNLIIADIAV